MNELQKRIRGFRKRIRFAYAWYGTALGGAIGALICLAWTALDYFGVFYAEWLWLGILVVSFAVVGALIGYFKPVRDERISDSIDRRAGLKNRVGTALMLSEKEDDFCEAQRIDALGQISKIEPRKLFPLKYYRWHSAILALGVLASLVFMLGNTPLFLSPQQKADREELQKAVKAVERVAKPVLEQDSNASEEEKEVARQVEKFARDLKRGRLSKEEALEKGNDLLQKAEELAKNNQAKADKTLGEADTALDKLMRQKMDDQGLTGADPEKATATPEELESMKQSAQSKIDQVQKKLQDGKPKSDAEKAKLEQDLQKAKDELKQVELSKKAQETFAKMMQMKEWRELQEMAKKLAGKPQQGKKGQSGSQKPTKEQMKEMQKRLEELAKQLKDDKAMREYIQKLKDAMKKKEGG